MSDQQATEVPQVLTKSAVAAIIGDLDAGDVLECYLLTRDTRLHGLANSTLRISKQALGLRYRPPANAESMHGSKNPLELTLEYGPLRAGAVLEHESIPVVNVADDNTVAWDNQGRVYYTGSISTGNTHFHTASYTASLTGAVLQDLLFTAVEYSNTHRRYQPFAVYQQDKLLLRSSSDADFMQSVWKHLANVGVELAPVIQPVQWQVRLIADSADKVQVSTTVPDGHSRPAAADFYFKLYQCLEAIATANYQVYENKPLSRAPSMVPAMATAAPTMAPTVPLHKKVQEDTTVAPTITFTEPQHSLNATKANSMADNKEDPPRKLRLIQRRQDTTSEEEPSFTEPSDSPTDDADGKGEDAPASDSVQVAQAATEAAEAAEQADQAGNTQAAHAAHAAANAAQKAADVTASQAASMAMEALLHGDANVMADAAAECLENPRYGIVSSSHAVSNATTTTTAYLYWDGSFYYRVNLTAPYIQVVPLIVTMPQPPRLDIWDGGDIVDWSLALMILALFAIFMLLLLQQVLGRNFRIIRPLYKCQRWFFDPLHHSFDDLVDDEMQGTAYSFSEDVIPLSMGGRKVASPSLRYRDFFPAAEAWLNGSTHEVEMTGRLGTPNDNGLDDTRLSTSIGSGRLNNDSAHSYHSDEVDTGAVNMEEMKSRLQEDIPVRLVRDPDLVDLPDLRSRSKVAVPVRLVDSASGHSTPSRASIAPAANNGE